MAREPIYTEDCCFNWIRDCCTGGDCSCRCHVEVPVPVRPDCGHEAEIERYRQRSRDEDTVRIRLNHARIALRDALIDVATSSDGEQFCWCPENKPLTADHMPACRRARKALSE